MIARVVCFIVCIARAFLDFGFCWVRYIPLAFYTVLGWTRLNMVIGYCFNLEEVGHKRCVRLEALQSLLR